eukprot:732649-Karenia_brevis.AAC.1
MTTLEGLPDPPPSPIVSSGGAGKSGEVGGGVGLDMSYESQYGSNMVAEQTATGSGPAVAVVAVDDDEKMMKMIAMTVER